MTAIKTGTIVRAVHDIDGGYVQVREGRLGLVVHKLGPDVVVAWARSFDRSAGDSARARAVAGPTLTVDEGDIEAA